MASPRVEAFHTRDRRDDFPIFIHSELDDYGLDTTEFRVYARLARRAGQNGKHSESVPNMAREFDLSVRKVQYALKLLILCRLITRHPRPGKTDEYSLNPRAAWKPKSEVSRIRASIKPSGAPAEGTPSGAPGEGGAPREGGVVHPQHGVVVHPEIDEGTPYEGTPIKEEIRKPDYLFESVASVCRIDWRICTTEQRGQLNQTVGKLRKAGRTPSQVEQVGRWWFERDWRGRQGQAPTPAQLREVWAQAFTPVANRDEHPNAYRPGKVIY